jgi:hypothetical protein
MSRKDFILSCSSRSTIVLFLIIFLNYNSFASRQMTEAERAPAWKLADLPKKTNYSLEMTTFNATRQMFVEIS